jgi:hypothetical protein
VAGSTVKKVLVRRFDRENLTGFVNPFSYLQPLHAELLKTDGSLVLVPYTELKAVCFVRDFEATAEAGRVFLNRPKMDGLWVRMVMRDGETLDGILPNDLLAAGVAGFTFTPPEPDGNNQRIFVPREALRSIQVLGVVGSPLRAKRRKPAASADQPSLF